MTIVSPRNCVRQKGHAVVVKVEVHDFQLSGRRFGGEPELGEGNLRFGLNRSPTASSRRSCSSDKVPSAKAAAFG